MSHEVRYYQKGDRVRRVDGADGGTVVEAWYAARPLDRLDTETSEAWIETAIVGMVRVSWDNPRLAVDVTMIDAERLVLLKDGA